MKNFLSLALPICFGVSLILGSCARDNSVASNNRVQKRKYTSGYHIAFNKKKKSVKDETVQPKTETTLSHVETEKSIETGFVTISESKNTDQVFIENQLFESKREISSEESEIKAVNQPKSREQKSSFRSVNQLESNKNFTSTSSVQKIAKNKVIKEVKTGNSMRLDSIVYILLCIFIPFLAVGLATNWDLTKTLIAVLLTIFFWLPGIIYAFIICADEGVI